MTYGKRLDQALIHANKSRRDLSTHLGCVPQTIGIVITGAGKISRKLSADNHAKAVDFLRVNGDWLLTGDGDMLPGAPTITAPSPTLVVSDYKQNQPLAPVQQALPATNNVASLDCMMDVLTAHLSQADEDTRTAAAGLLSGLAKSPDNPNLRAALTALLTPSGFAEPLRKMA